MRNTTAIHRIGRGSPDHPPQSVPTAPFRMWVTQRYHEIVKSGTHAPSLRLAEELGVSDRTLRRYIDGVDSSGKHVTRFERNQVENMLHRAGVQFWELYPGIDPEVVLEPDKYCGTCRDSVTPIEGVCPWCEGSDFPAMLTRQGPGPIPLARAQAILRAKWLRETHQLTYSTIATVMGVYHGDWATREIWRYRLRAAGVAGETGGNRIPPHMRKAA